MLKTLVGKLLENTWSERNGVQSRGPLKAGGPPPQSCLQAGGWGVGGGEGHKAGSTALKTHCITMAS